MCIFFKRSHFFCVQTLEPILKKKKNRRGSVESLSFDTLQKKKKKRKEEEEEKKVDRLEKIQHLTPVDEVM